MNNKRTFRNLFGLVPEKKTVPAVESVSEITRGGLPKSYIPNFFYKPPFGYPRYEDLPNLRRLAATPFVDMCITTIIDEISAVPWEIVSEESGDEISPEKQKQIDHVKSFFDNPNTNKESWEKITRVFVRDILEIDAGVINKIYNRAGEMVEIVARDGATFTKNPDLHGFITDREDILFDSTIVEIPGAFNTPESQKILESSRKMEPGWITAQDVREKAAYFQYGWITGARPVPFGKKEIVWLERNPRSDSVYGRSPVEILADSIQTLIYAIEHNLDYFRENSIPPGVIGLDGSDSDEIKAFKEQWEEQQRVKDSAGKWKKVFHKMPVIGKMPKFERLGFTNSELQLIEGQQWWAKMVWACFGVTAVELGYTEDAKGMANQLVQSNVFRKRAINPLLRLIEYHVNTEIISEFGYEDIKFKYQMFDVEEETKKATLYKLQIDAGIKTVNEIRREEGMEDVEWGDDDPKRNQGTSFNFGDYRNQNQKEDDGNKNSDEEKSIDKKSFQAQQNPLIPKEGEEMGYERLRKSIVYVLKKNEEKLKDIIEKEIGQDKLSEIKSVDDVVKAIKQLMIFEGLKNISDTVIKKTFMDGWDSAEKQLNRNFMINKRAVQYIQDYAFNNIMDLTEEIKNDLRAELQRGIMSGEGITDLKNRVKKVFDSGENRAEMIARTETTRAENQGKLQAFKSSNEDFLKKWVATKDDRTSEICMRLNGQTVGLNENFKDDETGWEGPAPPAHVNCRSSVVFISKKEDKE